MAILIDSCVLLDLFTKDPQWCAWSVAAVRQHILATTIILNPVVYAEASMRFDTIEEFDALVEPFQYRPLSRQVAFLAGKAFLHYRKRGGPRTALLPDFLIGAHAAVDGLDLLTRDPARFRTYFPSVHLICPDNR